MFQKPIWARGPFELGTAYSRQYIIGEALCRPNRRAGLGKHRTPSVHRFMPRHHLVRVGVLGHVGRFTSVDATRFPRGARVVVRTSRGLELGEILAPPADD